MSGYLDGLSVNQVGTFEEGFLTVLRSDHQDLLDDIRDKREISDETRDGLTAAADAFAKVFA